MQNLSAQASGNACTIKVIQNFCGNMIVSAAGRQFAVSKDIADRIKV